MYERDMYDLPDGNRPFSLQDIRRGWVETLLSQVPKNMIKW